MNEMYTLSEGIKKHEPDVAAEAMSAVGLYRTARKQGDAELALSAQLAMSVAGLGHLDDLVFEEY